MDVLQFGEKSGGPDTVTLFEWLVCGICRLIGVGFLVFIVSIFDEGRERAGATGVDASDFLLLGLALLKSTR